MSKERKNRVRIMKKLLVLHNDGNPIKREYRIEKKDVSLVMTLKAHGSLMNEAFPVSRDRDDNICVDYFATVYPFTSSGEEYLSQGWYVRVMKSSGYNVARDVASFLAVGISAVLAYMKAFM
jgi:hypothetical protein